MTSNHGLRTIRLHFLSVTMLAVPVLVSGCAAGTATSLSQAPLFLAEATEASGEAPSPSGVDVPAIDGAAAVAPTSLVTGGNAVLPLAAPGGGSGLQATSVLGLQALGTSAAVQAGAADATVTLDSSTVLAGTAVAASTVAAASTVGQFTGGTAISAGGSSGGVLPGVVTSVGANANSALPSSTSVGTSALAPTVVAAVPPVAVAVTSALVTTGQVLGTAPAGPATNVANPQNQLITTTAVGAVRMCLKMKGCS